LKPKDTLSQTSQLVVEDHKLKKGKIMEHPEQAEGGIQV
jgi:hypothetical protein